MQTNSTSTCRTEIDYQQQVSKKLGGEEKGKLFFKIYNDPTWEATYERLSQMGKTVCVLSSAEISWAGNPWIGVFQNKDSKEFGKVVYDNGVVIEGNMRISLKKKSLDLIQAQITYPSGKKEEGKFKEGKLKKGKITEVDGKIIEGKFKEGKLKKGTITHRDGTRYSGIFQNFELYGSGEMKLADGCVLKGHFIKNQLQGKGEKIFQDGTKIKGKFTKNFLQGQGKKILRNGTKIKGNFQDDKLDDEQATIFYQSGDILKGKFIDDKFYGDIYDEKERDSSSSYRISGTLRKRC